MVDRRILKLARYLGIDRSFIDAWGNPTEVNTQSIIQIINAMGFSANTPDEASWTWDQLKDQTNRELFKSTLVIASGSTSLELLINAPAEIPEKLFWSIKLEDGGELSGEIALASCHCFNTNRLRSRLRIGIDVSLEEGYHQLSLKCGNRSSSTLLICTPAESFYDECFNDNKRIWGVTVQLYSLRSRKSWGIGDFSDLRKMTDSVASAGGGYIGLNPLHALSLHNLASFSPYSPSSRTMLNPLYIAIDELPETQTCDQYQALLADDGFLAQITELNDAPLVSYDGVWRIKRRALKILFEHFLNTLDDQSDRLLAYRSYCKSWGKELTDYARFEAVGAKIRLKDPHCWGYPVWPDELKAATRSGTVDIPDQDIEFFKWIQWVAHEQLQEASRYCSQKGMPIGLYLDLALSSDKSGYDVWNNPSSYALDLDVGAPPDILNSKGQNWGFAPMKPAELFQSGFSEFRSVLRSAMKYAGAIRLDHVMALMRLFCIPRGSDPARGAYVTYFLRDLMSVVSLESKRNNCVIIGEDLGTVPPEVQREMARRKILSYKVIQFMSQWGGNFVPSADYPEVAMTTPGTHDTATLPGWWSGLDIETRKELDLFPDDHNPDDYRKGREQEKRGLLERLNAEGIRQDNEETFQAALNGEFSLELMQQISAFAAKTSCRLIALPLEDILLIKEQVNVPGVTTEYPCWRQKLPLYIEDPVLDEHLQKVSPFSGKSH